MRTTYCRFVYILAMTFLSHGCFAPSVCSDEKLTEAVSPNQERIAKAFVRDCGATTGWVTHVEMRWQSSDQMPEDIVFTVRGKPKVELKWLNDLTLSVGCQDCSEELTSRRVTKLGKVTMRFNE